MLESPLRRSDCSDTKPWPLRTRDAANSAANALGPGFGRFTMSKLLCCVINGVPLSVSYELRESCGVNGSFGDRSGLGTTAGLSRALMTGSGRARSCSARESIESCCIASWSGAGIPLRRGCTEMGLTDGTSRLPFVPDPESPFATCRGSGADRATSAVIDRSKLGRACARELAMVDGGSRLTRRPFLALSSSCLASKRP